MDLFIISIIIIVVILFIIIQKIDKKEHLTTDEVLQNISSVYNNDQLNVRNLNVTNNITASNFYPIGSIYLTMSNINPNKILGFGSWEELPDGKLMMPVKSSAISYATDKKIYGNDKITNDHLREVLTYTKFDCRVKGDGEQTAKAICKIDQSKTRLFGVEEKNQKSYIPLHIYIYAWYRLT